MGPLRHGVDIGFIFGGMYPHRQGSEQLSALLWIRAVDGLRSAKPLKRRRNGAGKSTTLRVLTGLITPDSAQRVGGRLDERTDPTRFRARLDALIEARFLRCNQGC